MFKDLVISRLSGLLSPEEIRRWFEPLTWEYDQETEHLRLTAPTPFHQKHLAENYIGLLQELAADTGGHRLLSLTLESRAQDKPTAPLLMMAGPDQGRPAPQLSSLVVDHTFERFLINDSNRLAALAAHDLAQGSLTLAANSIFIFSPGPWGKTHLLSALAWHLTKIPGRRFLHLSAGGGPEALASPKRRPRGLVLLIDDVHLLVSHPEAQQRLVRFIDEMPASESALVSCAHLPPHKLINLIEPLRSRLSGGLVLKIDQPEYKLLFDLANRRADELNLPLSPETLSQLVRRAEGDPRRLGGFFESIAFITSRGEIKAEKAAARLYPDLGLDEQQQVEPDTILSGVAAAFGLKVSDLTGHSKLRQAAWPRRVAMYLVKEITGLTTAKVGECFGNRDHSTVIHALKKINEELKNPAQAQLVENIKRSLLVG